MDLRRLGIEQIIKKDYNKAVELLSLSLSEQAHCETYLNRGIAWYKLSKWDLCLEDCNQALQLN